MKKYISICLGIYFMFSLGSCSDYLDINKSPDSANSTFPTPELRLRSILNRFCYAYEVPGSRAAWVTWNITKTYGTATNDQVIKWRPPQAFTTWAYQKWFIDTAANLPDMFDKCNELEAWHYLGAAQIIHAWGFMTMVDVYGEMPYTEAISGIISPKYDDGKTIFYGCMDMLDEAIANLQKQQPANVVSLSEGDIWNGGDIDKWLALAYGLKARWTLNTSKKASFDPNKVLELLDKAPQSNATSTIMRYRHSDVTADAAHFTALQHQNLTVTSSRITKWYLDLLTNTFTGGGGVMDPRTTRMAPSALFRNDDDNLEYRLTEGVDLKSPIRNSGGPVAFDVYHPKSSTLVNFYTNVLKQPVPEHDAWGTGSANVARAGDSIYIPIYSDRFDWITQFPNPTDDRYIASRYNGSADPEGKTNHIISTGTFYTRADAPGHFMCYHEVCFMRAECYFRLGQKGRALIEYKNGIRAHMELMNEKLQEYDQTIYGKQVMTAAEIDAFMASSAVAQTDAELTMAKIMQQKFIACSYSIQNWNDMRRFNYSAGNIKDFGVVYVDYARPAEFDAESAKRFISNDDPNHERYWFRRLQQCSHETERNLINLEASNPEAMKETINSYPVWWDTADE